MMRRPRHPVAAARHRLGLSRAALAALVGLAELDVARIERGTQWPTAVEAVRLARHLRLSLAEVLIEVIEAQARAGGLPPQQQARAG